MNCLICGCDEYSACHHPEAGSCWWQDESFPLCSHCADPKLIPGSERNALDQAPDLTKNIFRKYLERLDLFVSIRSPGKKHTGHGQGFWNVELKDGDIDMFDSMITLLFDPVKSTGRGSWSFKPTDLTIRKEALP